MYIQHTYGKLQTLIFFFLSLKDIHELREILHSLTGEVNVVKMSNFPNLRYIFNTIPMKIPQSCFSDVDNCTILIRDVSFPSSSDSKESACNAGDLGSIPGLARSPGGGHDNSLQYSCLENPHGQRSLVGYSPWGHKESDTTE